jgi:serine/threonine protein kinase
MKNYYDILEVNPRARRNVIHAAWRELSKDYGDGNPDRRLLNEAYEILSDAGKRKAYDESRMPKAGKIVRIGNYRLLNVIAEGGFGVTYRAVHELLGEEVCIKHSHDISPFHVQMALEEARVIWNLRHWAIPSIRDVIQLDDGNLAIVMSYIPGENLQTIIERKQRMKPESVCRIAERVLNVFAYFHDNKVIHGDVKPANIIIPDGYRVVVVDYGLSINRPSSNSTAKGFTPAFASPEQLNNTPLLPESDLYSLGLTMIYALGGDPKAGTVPGDVPDPVCNFIKQLIRRDVSQRPHWDQEKTPCQMISDVRFEAFGRRESGRDPLDIK